MRVVATGSTSGYQYPYARKLCAAIETGEFQIDGFEPYMNTSGEWGLQYRCSYRQREFYLSESRSDEPSDARWFLKVLKDESFDLSKPIIWPDKFGRPCLYLEAWYLGHWYEFHTPLRKGPDDEFRALIKSILIAELKKVRSA